ncbi:hypothetical protein AGLY_006672 [Aphis glycines]|uniref:Uncharacterized protein n=1 Tax=Aphis glycines TaxID=307491 RepID=A0A6G0TSM5_APHGL|nr:hypothetical protein AGLY_006672 [Aphis glycines]
MLYNCFWINDKLNFTYCFSEKFKSNYQQLYKFGNNKFIHFNFIVLILNSLLDLVSYQNRLDTYYLGTKILDFFLLQSRIIINRSLINCIEVANNSYILIIFKLFNYSIFQYLSLFFVITSLQKHFFNISSVLVNCCHITWSHCGTSQILVASLEFGVRLLRMLCVFFFVRVLFTILLLFGFYFLYNIFFHICLSFSPTSQTLLTVNSPPLPVILHAISARIENQIDYCYNTLLDSTPELTYALYVSIVFNFSKFW